MPVITGLLVSKEQETRKPKEKGRKEGIQDHWPEWVYHENLGCPFLSLSLRDEKEGERQTDENPRAVFCSVSQQCRGRVLWGEAKSNECTEKRKEGFAQSTSQNYHEAACGGGQGWPLSFFSLGRRSITELRGLPRLGSKNVAAVAWISLQNK